MGNTAENTRQEKYV